jgi:ABC-type nitrate/sulfonate/bicarbonate transport system substrate-binding protein
MTTSRRDFLRSSLALAATVGAGGVLAACGDDEEGGGAAETGAGPSTTAAADSSTTTSAPEVQRLTVMMPFTLSPNFIADIAAKSSGAMAAHGIDLDLQFAQGAPQALQQLAAGNVTIIRNGPVETLQAIVNEDAPFMTIGMVNQRTNYTLTSLPESAYALTDLGGLTVGLPTLGGNAEFVLDLVLRAADVDPATVGRQAVGNEASAYGVMQEGVVDALFVTTSAVAAIRAAGQEPHVDPLADVNPLLGTNLVTTQQFIDERRDVIVAYLAALHETMIGLNDPARRAELVAAVVADDWELPQLEDPAAADRIVASVAGPWFADGEENLLRNLPERWEAGVAELVELGVLPEGSAATDFYTNDLLDEAVG